MLRNSPHGQRLAKYNHGPSHVQFTTIVIARRSAGAISNIVIAISGLIASVNAHA